jgi:hypothetical protein
MSQFTHELDLFRPELPPLGIGVARLGEAVAGQDSIIADIAGAARAAGELV